MARPRAPRRGRRAAGARLGGDREGAGGARAAARRAVPRGGRGRRAADGRGLLHAHNLQPSLGWRALAAARGAGAGVVLHLHQYRLVCAVGVCFTRGQECTRCHGRNTLPGLARNCRGSVPEAAVYAAALAAWQRRLVELADVILVPSRFARERLAELGAPLPWERVRVLAPPLRRRLADGRRCAAEEGLPQRYALVVSRLAPEKGIDVAIAACRRAGMSARGRRRGPGAGAPGSARAGRADVRLLGAVDDDRLARLRAGAAVALAPSRSAETFGLAVAEAMAAGRAGARQPRRRAARDPRGRRAGRAGRRARAGRRRSCAWPATARPASGARARIAAVCGPDVVARGLADAYGQARERAAERRPARTS